MPPDQKKPSPVVDVILLLEGTYPFVPGGVSSWVHGIIDGMPDLTFGLIFLGANYEPRKMRYKLPDNVSFLSEIGLYDYLPQKFHGTKRFTDQDRNITIALLEKFCFELQQGHMPSFDQIYDALSRRILSLRDLAYDAPAWQLIKTVYQKNAGDISFIDFFWTWRYAYLPILNLFYIDLPPARLYHTVCTGWAGYLGVIAKKRYNVPLLLTEHGIYLNERRIEISQAEWMDVEKADELSIDSGVSYFKEMWINLFNATANLCYDRSEAIYTLYGGNRQMEIDFGAPADRIQIIPNGVDIEALTPEEDPEKSRSQREKEGAPLRVGFVGRVVSIKDVKTLIRACRRVIDKLPNIEILLMGPTDEEKDYFTECQNLVELLQLGDKLSFLGRINVREYYPTLDLQVLTSISEGQPLVILEGYCSGVPVVATKVGACQEMIEGLTPEDQAIGPSGIVTKIGNPEETAMAILKILTNPELRREMAKAAQQRVRMFYDYRHMITRYRDIYGTFCREPQHDIVKG